MNESAADPSFIQQVMVSGIGFFGLVTVGLISFFGGRGSVQAQLQGQLNDSMKMYIGELKADVALGERRIVDLEARSAALEQYNLSLARILREADIPVPPPPKTETVFVLAPQMPTGN